MTPAELAKPNTEHSHQVALMQAVTEYRWHNREDQNGRVSFACEALEWLFAIPNGGERHAAVANKMKVEGAKAGVYDLFLPCPIVTDRPYTFDSLFSGAYGAITPRQQYVEAYHGLCIEMKKPTRRNHKDGGLSDDQLRFQKFVGIKGYAHVVCYTWEEAFAALKLYLGVE